MIPSSFTLTVLLILCAPAITYGQEFRIHGIAKHEQDGGIADLDVGVWNTHTERTYKGNTTRSGGSFDLTLREGGQWTINVSGRRGDWDYIGEVTVFVNEERGRTETSVGLGKSPRPRRRPSRTLVVQLVRFSLRDSPRKISQSAEFRVAGTITASDGQKTLPRVKVILTNLKTGEVKATQAGKDASFSVNIETSGNYDLTFLSDGYKPESFRVIREKDEDSTEDFIAVFSFSGEPVVDPLSLNVRLKLLPPDESESAAVGMTMDATKRYSFSPRLMEALPVPGNRSFDHFALLAPGVAPPPQTFGQEGPGVSPGVGTAGQFSINGLRPRENNFAIDGSDNNDEDIGVRRQGFVALTPQPIETLQEYQVITALADARFGRDIGGQINALTKTGSPSFHGSAYGFITSDKLNARDYFDQSSDAALSTITLTRSIDQTPILFDGRPLMVRNPVASNDSFRRIQAGFTVSGPFKLLKNTFFFSSLEYKNIHATKESHFAVPTVKQRGFDQSGDTGLILPTGPGTPLYSASVPGNAIFSLFPFPNNPLGPYGENTYSAVLPANGKAKLFSAKLDKQFGVIDQSRKRLPWSVFANGDIVTARYNFSQDVITLPVTGGAIFSGLRPTVRTQNTAVFVNRTLSTNTSDTIRLSIGRTRLRFNEVRDPYLIPSSFLSETPFLLNAPLLLNLTAPDPNGMLNPVSYVSAASPAGASVLNSLGYSSVTQTEQITGPLGQVIMAGFSPLGVDASHFPQSRANNTFQIADTVTHLRSPFVLSFGFDLRRTQINSTLEKNFRPTAVFNGLHPFGTLNLGSLRCPVGAPLENRVITGASLAAAGVPTALFHTLAANPDSAIRIKFTQFNLFGQFEWRFRSLLLSAGARYEVNTVPQTAGRKVEQALDLTELRRLAEEAVRSCNDPNNPIRCNDLVSGIVQAFPADFEVTFGADKDDIDLRLGLAVRVPKLRDTVIRGGFGQYSGQFPGAVLNESRNAFPNFLPMNYANFSPRLGGQTYLLNLANPNVRQLDPRLNVVSPGTINTFPGSNPIVLLANSLVTLENLSLDGPTIIGLDLILPQRALNNPYSLQGAITIERQLGLDYLVSASYVWTRGGRLLRMATPNGGTNNSILRFTQIAPVTNQSSFPFFQGTLSGLVPTIAKSFSVIPTFFTSNAYSNYHALQIEVRKRYRQRFQFGSVFTYSHAIDDASDFFDLAGSFALPQRGPGLIGPAAEQAIISERASSNFDVRLRSVSSFVVDIPFPFRRFGQQKSKFGNLQFAGIITAQTGQPYTINTIYDINRDGNLTDRLFSSRGLNRGPLNGDRRTLLHLAPGTDPLALLDIAFGRDGHLDRNSFRAPGIFNIDTSLSTSLPLREGTAQFRIEVFNLLNRPNFGIPVRILEHPGFGKSVNTTLPARTIQFAVKYAF